MASDTSVRTIQIKPSLNFPFLLHKKTIEHVRNSKVMFIMRGLPGSGKSTIVRKILEIYEEGVICSADDYFLMDGEYHFDHDKLSEAHDSCHSVTEKACSSSRSPIIVDNTNVRQWEMKYYVELAAKYDYTVIVVLPKTKWRWDTAELSKCNKHRVTQEYLEKRKKSFDRGLPLYYGWFLNGSESKKLIELGKNCFSFCMEKIPKFAEQMRKTIDAEDVSKVKYDKCFSRESSSTGTLHCTSYFSLFGKSKSSHQYASSDMVKQNIGKLSSLYVIGLVLTPRTISARVRLTSKQLLLWAKDDEEKQDGGVKSSDEGGVQMLVKDKNSLAYQTLKAMGMTEESDEVHGASQHIKSKTKQKKEKRKERKVMKEEEEEVQEKEEGWMASEQGEIADNWEDLLEEDQAQAKRENMSEVPADDVDDVDDEGVADNWEDLGEEEDADEEMNEKMKNICVADESNEKETGNVKIEKEDLKETNRDCSAKLDEEEEIEVAIEEEEPEEKNSRHRFSPTDGFGSRAHITLGYSPSQNAVQAGHDMVDIVECEKRMIDKPDNVTLKGGTVRWYGQGRCVVYFDKPLTIPTIFTGKY